MSKASELRLIRGQRSADAAINYHHRSGDSEGSGGEYAGFLRAGRKRGRGIP